MQYDATAGQKQPPEGANVFSRFRPFQHVWAYFVVTKFFSDFLWKLAGLRNYSRYTVLGRGTKFDPLYLGGFPTSISCSTSNTLGGLSPTVKALLRGDGQQYANARSTRHSMFAMKPEVEIWPHVGCFSFLGERIYLSMVPEKIVRISSETAEI